MSNAKDRLDAYLSGLTVEQVQQRNQKKNNIPATERIDSYLSKSSQQANTAYRNQQRRQKLHAEEQERKRAAQNKVQMQKIGKQTNRQRVDTGENESKLGYGNYLSYKGTDQREIPWKQLTQDQIAKAKQEAAEKQAATRKATSRGGGFGANGAVYEAKPSLGKTILNVANKGAGEGFVTPVYETLDFLANLAPNAVAGIKGVEDPESTFTGQLFKPVTDATQKALDYVKGETGASAAIVQEATKGNKAAQLAADIGSGVVGAIPNAALAIMTAGGSLPALAPQTAGASGTIMNAVQKVASNPSFQLSYIQTLGGAYQDAKDAGASELNASAAAFISAAANALVEVGGGLETLPGELKAEDLSTFDKALKWVTSALDEGKEEVVQGVISSLTNKAAANSDAPYFSTTDENAVINPARMGKEFGMGTAVGAVLGGAQTFGTDAINRISNRHTGANAASNANTGSNADATVTQPLRNAESDYAGVDTETAAQATDPMEFAVRETMKPSKERQAMDEAIRRTADWMNGRERGNAEATAPAVPQEVQNQETNSDNDMGAKKSDFEHEVKQSKSKTVPDFYKKHNVPENARTTNEYTVVTEAESLHNARTRLEQDYDGEMMELRNKPVWTNEEVDMGQMILEDLWYESTESGDNSAFLDWDRVVKQHKQEIPRALQAMAKWNRDSGTGIVSAAIDILYGNSNTETNSDNTKSHGTLVSNVENADIQNQNSNLRKGVDAKTVLGTVSDLARQYDNAVRNKDVGELIRIIKETAGKRKTAYTKRKNGTTKSSKYLDWALNRIAKYAKSGGSSLAGTEELQTPLVQNYTIEPGDKVRVSDRNNFGTVTSVNEDGSHTVHFKSRDGHRATKRFSGDMVTKTGQNKPSLSRARSTADTTSAGAAIDASNIQNPDVAFQFLQDFASTGILNIAADTQKASMGTKLMALRRSGMLSKLATALRNLSSNSGFNIVDTIARDVSVPLDMLLSNFTKTRSVAMDYGYLSKAARQGSLDNIAMASLETSLDVNGRRNSGKYASGGMRTFKANGNIVERFLSNLEALQGYEMYVTDEMSKGRTQAGVQEGINNLYDRGKIKTSDDSLRNAGHQEADYRTFQNDSKLSEITLNTRNALNSLHVGDVGAGDVLMPFAQVPANLADRAIDYSPAGLAKTTGKMVDAISKAKRGKFTAADQAAVVQSLGRNITGTVMIGIAAALAANGLIRVVNPGGEDENKDKAALEKMQGQNGTQWNLSATKRKLEGGDPTWQSGDDLISIAFMEPMNAQLTIGALLAEDMEQEGQLTAKTAFKDSFAGSLAAILDLPMMDTIGDAIDAYNYSSKDRIGDKLVDAGTTLAANEVSSLIPNWMKGVRQGLDPYQRDMYSKDDVWGQVADQYQAVFGDRNELPIKQDSFGRDMANDGGVRNFLNANVLPGYVTTYKGNELTDEITRLAEETGSNAIFPSRKAPDELTVDGEKLPLSYEERQQYQKVYGNMDEAIRTGLMESDAYSKLSSEERYKAHQFSEDFAKQTASSAVNKDYDADNWVEELQGKSEAEIVEAVLYKTFSALADGKQYTSKYDGMDDLMDQGKLSDAMAITMMPEGMKTAYTETAKKGGVSVNEWLDMYAYAYPAGKTDKGTQDKGKVRNAALEYINRQNWGEDKKLAAASAIFEYLPNTLMTDANIPYDWALSMGESGLAYVENGMSDGQKENYDKYVKGHLDNDKMKLYLDAYKFKGKAKSDYEEDGKTVKYSAKNKVIDYIDSLSGLTNREKIRIYLGLGYSDKNIPNWWY